MHKLRQKYISQPILNKIKAKIPDISKTEEIAINAGNVWFDRELFSGNPDWSKLYNLPITRLTEAEQDFIKGPVEELCGLVDNWEISKNQDFSAKIWKYILKNKFFGMVIETRYEGLGFSAYAHSQVIAKLATRNLSLATTVAVPNSLGPGELLQRYGTKEQQEHYLPRLATGKEVPCFALTNPKAGSDATSMPDYGVVCFDEFEGNKVLGIRLNWEKRYITLAPIATLLGLAFKLYDPDKLLGEEQNIGITCALIPVKVKGVEIGARHYPLTASFMNGPTKGRDVFIPLDYVIGGKEMLGEGWRMLVECLSCGRAISIPSLSAGGMQFLSLVSGAYSVLRKQFKQPICNFEGVQTALVRIVANTYIAESARMVTCSAIDAGNKPSILGAILKSNLSEMAREAVIHAMDIHGGKGIIQGPKNYLS